MAAGPDGFHQPSPIPHIEQQAFWTKLGVSWFTVYALLVGRENFHAGSSTAEASF